MCELREGSLRWFLRGFSCEPRGERDASTMLVQDETGR